MTRCPSLSPDTAQGAARSLLGDLVARHGEIGAMVATMAHSPAVLGGYLDLNRAMKRSKLPRHITERISLAVQQRQGCDLCLAAHISAARAAGVIDSEIADAREGTSADPAIAAIVAFGLQVYAAPATITDDQITGLRRSGRSSTSWASSPSTSSLEPSTSSQAFNPPKFPARRCTARSNDHSVDTDALAGAGRRACRRLPAAKTSSDKNTHTGYTEARA